MAGEDTRQEERAAVNKALNMMTSILPRNVLIIMYIIEPYKYVENSNDKLNLNSTLVKLNNF